MANIVAAVDNYYSQGVNGIEADLRFSSKGNPTEWKHGAPCDCTCKPRFFITKYNICKMKKPVCRSGTKAKKLLEYIAKFPFRLFLVDSKVDDLSGAALDTAGKKVINYVDKYLFAKGFKGQVSISCAKLKSSRYITAAVKAVEQSKWKSRIFFTIDQEKDNYSGVYNFLKNLTKNRIFGTGTSACATGTYYKGIKEAAKAQKKQENGLTYIWTIDKDSSIEKYLKKGANGIMSNVPHDVIKIIKKLGGRMANSNDWIPFSK